MELKKKHIGKSLNIRGRKILICEENKVVLLELCPELFNKSKAKKVDNKDSEK